MSPLLTCPLCSQPGFQTLDSLRRGLISAATRQVVCPVCHDVLFGLDKFTIHLFCHSVEHQQVTNNPLPSPRVEQMQVNQQQINTHCTSSQTDFSSITEDQTSVHSIEKVNTSSNNTQISNISIPTSHSVFNPITVQQRHVQAVEKVNKKTVHNVGATNVDNLRSQIVEYEQAHKPQELKCKESLESKTADLAMKSTLLSGSELMDTSQSTGSSTSIYVSSDDLKRTAATHENISAQCSADQHHSKVDLPLVKTVKEIVRCDLCGFAFDDLSILAIHIQLVHSLGNNSDTTDDKIQNSKASKQEKIADDKRQFPCHLCSKAFKMRGSLMVHLRVAHSTCIGTGKFLVAKGETENHSEERKFGCHLCTKSFKKEQHLTQHLKTHDGKQWECDVCSKMFTTKYFLKKHKRLHTGETPYSCDTCGKTFTFQQSYHKHLLYHSDEKPHVCNECDRAFKELSTLHNHQRIHTGEKPFACETCGKCFRQRVSYLVHRRIHTGAMPYQCTACGKSFRYKVSQRTHKCPAQPPGTVVRQSSDLVQKLLQGVKRKSAFTSSQVPAILPVVDNKGRNNSSEEMQMPSVVCEQPLDCTTSHQQQEQKQKPSSNHFTIIIGTDNRSVFSSGQIILAQTSLYDMPTDKSNSVLALENNVLGNKEMSCSSHNQENKIMSKNNEINNVAQELSIAGPSREKMKNVPTYGSRILVQDGNYNLNIDNSKDNAFPKLTNIVKPNLLELGDMRESADKRGHAKTDESTESKHCSQDAKFLHESRDKNNICDSPCNREGVWKSCRKKQKSNANTDLAVETTDFFNMVMSPSEKSLPSPAERLKHLTLSSPTDTLIGYEDDGLYEFLLRDEAGSSVLQEKDSDNNTNGEISHRNNASDSEPLQTINEESLKQLLYGSAKS